MIMSFFNHFGLSVSVSLSLCLSYTHLVCTSVMCHNDVGGEHRADSEDPSWWQRKLLLPDEPHSEWWERDTTPLLPLCNLLLIFTLSLSSPSPIILLFLHSIPLPPVCILQKLSLHLFSLSSFSLVIPILPFPVVRFFFSLLPASLVLCVFTCVFLDQISLNNSNFIDLFIRIEYENWT